MNLLEKARTKVADKLYSTPPERNANGNVVTKAEYEYVPEEEALYIKIDKLCRLKFGQVSEQHFQHFTDFKANKVTWTNAKEVAQLCIWFKTRNCEGFIRKFTGSWYENKISDKYHDDLIDALIEESVYQQIA